MAASTNDLVMSVRNEQLPVVTTVSSARSIDGTTLSCNSLTGWPTATAVPFVTYKKTTDGEVDKDTLISWIGIVSGNTITGLVLQDGTDTGNAVNDYVELVPSSTWADRIYQWTTIEHKASGKHGDITADSVSTAGSDKLIFSTASSQPDNPPSGKTLIWFEPLS